MTAFRLLYFIYLALFSSLFFLACEEETALPREDKGFDYFPIAIGQEWRYEMDSIILRPQVGGIFYDSIQLDVREEIVDTIRDIENQLWYLGERYDRRVDSTAWRFNQTFRLRTDANRALRREDNLEFVKMVFPLRDNQSWDGHASFNQYREIEVGGQPVQIFADWNYRYRQISGSATFDNRIYDNVTLVEGADYENLLNRRLSLEAYVRGIGLVYRELEVFETQCQDCCNGNTGACLDLPWINKAEAGFIIKQRLVE